MKGDTNGITLRNKSQRVPHPLILGIQGTSEHPNRSEKNLRPVREILKTAERRCKEDAISPESPSHKVEEREIDVASVELRSVPKTFEW